MNDDTRTFDPTPTDPDQQPDLPGQEPRRTRRPVGIAHLVFGLVFAGIALLWLIGEATDSDLPGFEVWGPVLLIGAGVVGLAATVFNSRRDRRATSHTEGSR